jgi:hypothetical protein
MQLNLFSEQEKFVSIETTPAQNQNPEYFYTVRWEEKIINPKTLTHSQSTRIKTAQAVYTSIEQVRDFVQFIQSTYSYCGWHHIIRHTEKPNLNCSNLNNFIL